MRFEVFAPADVIDHGGLLGYQGLCNSLSLGPSTHLKETYKLGRSVCGRRHFGGKLIIREMCCLRLKSFGLFLNYSDLRSRYCWVAMTSGKTSLA